MTLKLITPPTVEPISTDEVAAFLHVDLTEAATINRLIAAAREWAEAETGRALCAQVRELVLDAWPREIRIHCAPVPSITSITYTDSAGVAADFMDYTADLESVPARIAPSYGHSWPSATLAPLAAIRVRFPAGYSLAAADDAAQQAAVPSKIKDVMLRWIAWKFDHRDAAQDQIDSRGSSLVIPDAIERALANELADFKIWRF